MIRFRVAVVSALTAGAVLSACASGGSSGSSTGVGTEAAMTAVVNAKVYTVDESRGWADAFAYDADGVIVAVGTKSDVLAAAGDDATVIDTHGQMVLPGFQDDHVHVPEAGMNLDVCYFEPGLGLDEYGDLAAKCPAEQPDSEWVRAAGASLFDLRATDESPLDVLDRAVPDRPIIVLDDLGHAVWTNSAGLAAAGIGPDDPDPQGGVFHRRPDGRLDGLILENAQQLVRNAAAPDDATVYAGLLTSLDELASNGVTTISDAGGFWAQNHPAAWERASAEGALTVRAFNSLYVYPNLDIDSQLAELKKRFRGGPDPMLRFDTAKIYIDGILDLGTALMVEPYDVAPDPNYPSGFSYFTHDELQRYVNELHQAGFRFNFHTIGDQSVRDALDAVETIDAPAAEVAGRRHRTTHTYLVQPDDLSRFAELGVVADVQLNPDAIDPEYRAYLTEFIGERAEGLIPTTALLDAGAHVTLSSDWDAGPLSPLGTIERSLTRDIYQVPDLATAIELYTIEPAYALGHDDMTGSIEVGKYADYVVLDQNLFEIAPDAVDATKVTMTVVGGRVVYPSPAASGD